MSDEEIYEYKLAWQEIEDGPWSTAKGNGYIYSGTAPVLIFSGSHGIITISPSVKHVVKKIVR